MLLIGGCAGEWSDEPATLPGWEHAVEHYVRHEGNGDPGVLADLSWDDVHKGFGVLTDPIPDRSTDALGLLLAHRQIDGRPYFIFLLAMVNHGQLADLRPVVLNVVGDQFHWTVGPPNEHSIGEYDRATAGRRAGNAQPSFPAPGAVFEVSVLGRRIIVHHAQSAASWTVELPPIARGAT